MNQALILTSLLLFCHYLADYTALSMPEMLAAKRLGKPLNPIADHAYIHTVLMMLVMWFFILCVGEAYQIRRVMMASGLQFLTHFIIDVLKGRTNVWFPSVTDPTKVKHWVIFGLDQLLHQVVILIMVWMVLH